MEKSMNLPNIGANISASNSIQANIQARRRKPRIKIYVILIIGLVALIIGTIMSVIHFEKEDILGFDNMTTKPSEKNVSEVAKPVFTNENKTEREIVNELSDRIELSIATPPPDTQKAPTVNPLDLPYFMVATIVMSFGFMFVIVAVTWYK